MREKTILVVDDIGIIRRLVRVNLEPAGYGVIEATNGAEALERIKESKPDLVLLDVIMPVMDGFQVLQELRHCAGTQNIPVIMLTSCMEEVDQIKGREIGISGYITKPFDPDALIHLVNCVLSEHHAERAGQKRMCKCGVKS